MSSDNISNRFLRNSPIPDAELMINLGLYMNRQLLSLILFMHELYLKVIPVHGVVIEFGTRYGQNMSLFSSFRGMYEPYNMNRKLVCFDTFKGFLNTDKKDGNYEKCIIGELSVDEGYEKHLYDVLEYHQNQSPLSSIKRFDICKGDASVELEQYLENNPQTIVALAYFDMDLYEPTKRCLDLISPYLTKGSVVGFDELNVAEWPGETIAYKEMFSLGKYSIRRWEHSSTGSYIIVD